MTQKHKLALFALALGWALSASAQWQWLDKDGRKVFSDRPPPVDVLPSKILKQPNAGMARTAPPADSGEGSAKPPAQNASAPAAAGKDPALEKKKAEAEAAQAQKKKAEADRLSQARAENCARARQAKTTLNSGQLLAHTNAKGERGFMDDATRATENQRLDSVIASDCTPAR